MSIYLIAKFCVKKVIALRAKHALMTGVARSLHSCAIPTVQIVRGLGWKKIFFDTWASQRSRTFPVPTIVPRKRTVPRQRLNLRPSSCSPTICADWAGQARGPLSISEKQQGILSKIILWVSSKVKLVTARCCNAPSIIPCG